MTIADAVVVAAILAGPLLAIWAQRRIDRGRERKSAKLRIFQVLMATRAARVSPEHVHALNSIDIEFYGRRILRSTWQSRAEKAVIAAWNEYRDHLNVQTGDEREALRVWGARSEELFTDLLHALATAVGYDFDKVQLKRGIYTPKAHGFAEFDQLAIREGLAKILSGRASLPVQVVDQAVEVHDPPQPAAAQLPPVGPYEEVEDTE